MRGTGNDGEFVVRQIPVHLDHVLQADFVIIADHDQRAWGDTADPGFEPGSAIPCLAGFVYWAAMAARTSSLAARRAGQLAATRPSRAARIRKITRLDQGTTVSLMPWFFSEETSAMPMPVPMMIPMMAPKMARITASDRIMVRT